MARTRANSVCVLLIHLFKSRLLTCVRASSPSVAHQRFDFVNNRLLLVRIVLKMAQIIKDGGCSFVTDTLLWILQLLVLPDLQIGLEAHVYVTELFVSAQPLWKKKRYGQMVRVVQVPIMCMDLFGYRQFRG